ncbi:MAG: hypothetical protein LBV33_04560 [Lachnospiraceae bacterium]|jgi:hypothetical protein|nr:hypothetical protein [Lachnospiraceae bacterium]
MNYKKIQQWLDSHQLTLDESFSYAFRELAKKFKKTNKLATLDEVYCLIGVSKQDVSYWAVNPCGTRTKKSSAMR